MDSELLSWAKRKATAAGCVAESAAYLKQVNAWRQHWRPRKIRVLLIAESHVAEQPGDSNVRVSLPSRKGLPSGYCRLVYCLGYGEDGICDPTPVGNRGTIQFWDLFGQLASGQGNLQPRKGNSTLENRLHWKITTLESLCERGIWLVDSAAIAFYVSGGGRRFGGLRDYTEVLKESFERFVWPGVAREPIELICVIGRGVYQCLSGLPQLRGSLVISQPQDRNAARFRGDVDRLVSAVAQIQPFPRQPKHRSTERLSDRSEKTAARDSNSVGRKKMNKSRFPSPMDDYLVERISEPPQGALVRKWTLRDDNARHYHSRVKKSESPFFLRLSWCATAGSAVREVGFYKLNLDALLAAGYIRTEPGEEAQGEVRIRFFRNDDRVICIQTRGGGPALPVGDVE